MKIKMFADYFSELSTNIMVWGGIFFPAKKLQIQEESHVIISYR